MTTDNNIDDLVYVGVYPANPAIILAKLHAADRKSIDRYIEQLTAVVLQHDANNRPIYMLCDFRHGNVAATPYLRTKMDEYVKTVPNLPGRSAILLGGGIASRAFKLIAEQFTRFRVQDNHETKFFTDVTKAVEWLDNHD